MSDKGFDVEDGFMLFFHPNLFDAASEARAIACFISSSDISTCEVSFPASSLLSLDLSDSDSSLSLWIGSESFVLFCPGDASVDFRLIVVTIVISARIKKLARCRSTYFL
jgi:hypothetical protein